MKIKSVETKEEREQAFALRRDVFIEEQGVDPDIEWDGKDKEAEHFVIKKKNQVVATCRVRLKDRQAKVERMAVKRDHRGEGLGRKLLNYIIQYSKDKQLHSLILHAQKRVVDFYKKCGFKVISDEVFQEAGIDHLEMELKL